MNCLHITPHCGGGVGRVLLEWIISAQKMAPDQIHTICSLENIKAAVREKALQYEIVLYESVGIDIHDIFSSIEYADVIVVHWWNHPRLYDLLVNTPLPPCRLVVWSHVSGHNAPQIITRKIVDFPDRFVVATPWSFESTTLQSMSDSALENQIRYIGSTAGVKLYTAVTSQPNDRFTVGYIGTVDYCKLHPSFLKMSAAVNIPGVRFVVCGGDDHERLRHEADALDKSDRFIVTGPVDDVSSRLCTFDVFGYPLQPDHYGTGEQAIVEAMAAGLPVVVFNNGPERYIIDHNKTGLIVTSEQEYVAAIETLHRNPQLRRSLGEAARMAARERFSIEVMIDEWNTLFNALIKQSKKEHRWTADIPCSGALLYLESLGNAAVPFALSMTSTEGTIQRKVDKVIADLGGLFRSRTRGSPFHYFSVFNDDPYLKKWCTLIENACVRDGSER